MAGTARRPSSIQQRHARVTVAGGLSASAMTAVRAPQHRASLSIALGVVLALSCAPRGTQEVPPRSSISAPAPQSAYATAILPGAVRGGPLAVDLESQVRARLPGFHLK